MISRFGNPSLQLRQRLGAIESLEVGWSLRLDV